MCTNSHLYDYLLYCHFSFTSLHLYYSTVSAVVVDTVSRLDPHTSRGPARSRDARARHEAGLHASTLYIVRLAGERTSSCGEGLPLPSVSSLIALEKVSLVRSTSPRDPRGLGGLVGLNGDKERSRSVLLATCSTRHRGVSFFCGGGEGALAAAAV